MIAFDSFTLDNGLHVLVHEDRSVPTAVMGLLYRVGSRNENRDKTGFAHLFEHLMFGGSEHIPNYDESLQKIGGESNAFTSTDITQYYLTVSSNNIETGFWLESDRMLNLSFDPRVLDVQKKVVVEEFKQRYLNQPYGDVWMKLCPLVYRVHPYRWTTIGKEISHIERASMEDVKEFFRFYYRPDNAVLVLAGNVRTEHIKELAEKWFAPIPAGGKTLQKLPREPEQTQKAVLEVEADVPADVLYKAYRMEGIFHNDFYPTDLMSSMLGQGEASRLYQKLVKEKPIFNAISSFTMGTLDPGMVVITGMTKQGVGLEQAEEEVTRLVHDLVEKGPSKTELEKVKNQSLSALAFDEIEVLDRALNLSFATLSGDANHVNRGSELITSVSMDDMKRVGQKVLREENASVLFYRSTQSKNKS